MESKPSRAKRRISAKPSQGFMARFRRSDFCALVSLTAFSITISRKKKNPPPDALWRWVISADDAMKLLSQQPPRARAHACTTTTCTHADLAEIAETCHTISDTNRVQPTRQPSTYFPLMNPFDHKHQNFA